MHTSNNGKIRCKNKKCPAYHLCIGISRSKPCHNEYPFPVKLHKAIILLKNQYMNSEFNLIVLALQVGITPRHLRRLFTEIGATPLTCLNEMRYRKYLELLSEELLSHKECWVQAGFNSWSAFEYIHHKHSQNLSSNHTKE